jgi:hypothetical protein
VIPNGNNIDMIKRVASALGELTAEMVFVGGSTVGLLVTDPARAAVRATIDVDLVAEAASISDYSGLSSKLIERGFNQELGAIVCRWKYQDLIVDIMTPSQEILGATNRWYPKVLRDATEFRFEDGCQIRLLTAPLLVATKLEAFHDRGKGDYGASHDIEDIVVVVDGRPELIGEIETADPEIREYLREEFDDLLADERFSDQLRWHLGGSSEDQARYETLIDRLARIAGL